MTLRERATWRLRLLLGAALLSATASAQDAVRRDPCDPGRARAEVDRLIKTGLIAELSQFPPNVSVLVDRRRWDRSDVQARRGLVQAVACATGEPYAGMLRTVTVRAKDSTLLGQFSGVELTTTTTGP